MNTSNLSEYIAGAASQELPQEVRTKAKHHILDTIAAMLSGTELLPGKLALTYADRLAGPAEATVLGSGQQIGYTAAAFINGLLAHADETDDSHAPSLTHPGCAVVPAAITTADWLAKTGEDLIRAAVLGYDICTRMNFAITVDVLEAMHRSTYTISGAFGAMAAAAVLAGLTQEQVKYALSYTGQQASGLASWRRDKEHAEKAFVFAGLPVRAGTTAVDLVHAGFTGVSDVFEGPTHFFGAFSPDGEPWQLTAGLGSRFEIMRTNIKRWSVGSPIQAAADSLMHLIAKHGLNAANVRSVRVYLPEGGAETVDDRHMPDINCQYIMAVMLLDGDLAFSASQDYSRMNDPQVLNVKERVTLIGDPELNETDPPRQGIVEVTTNDGEELRHHTLAVRGTYDNQMSEAEVVKKTNDLLVPLMGTDRTANLVDAILNLEALKDVRTLRALLTV